MISIGMVTLDTANPRRIAAWWAERLGGEIVADYDGFFCIVSVPGSQVSLGFQLSEELAPGKNRLHLDLNRGADDDQQALVAEWTAAGAEHLGRRGDAAYSWDTFRDPDGNEFCIGDPH